MRRIDSTWVTEKSYWDGKVFVDRTSSERTKTLEMEIVNRNGKKILRFIGGPTGYESYYLDTYLIEALNNTEQEHFCICAGTVNSWPCVTVSRKAVADFINERI